MPKLDQTDILSAKRLRLALECAIGGRTAARRCSRTLGYTPPGERSARLRMVHSNASSPVNYCRVKLSEEQGRVITDVRN